MAGRIRTIKPEWLEDERIHALSLEARLLTVALLLLADDHGRGRANPGYVGGIVFSASPDFAAVAERALAELVDIKYIQIYQVRGQAYFEIRNWKKHQRVDKPGAPRVPPPEDPDARPSPTPAVSQPKFAYFMRGRMTGLIKIGESADPVSRLAQLSRQSSETLDLLAVANDSRTERELHALLEGDRVHGEWFRATPAVLAEVARYGGSIGNPIASAGYEGKSRIPNDSKNDSRPARDPLATDHRSPIPIPTTDPPRASAPEPVVVAEVVHAETEPAHPDPLVTALAASRDLRDEGVDLVRFAGLLRGRAVAAGLNEARILACVPHALDELAAARADNPARSGRSGAFVSTVVLRVGRPGVLEREIAARHRPPERGPAKANAPAEYDPTHDLARMSELEGEAERRRDGPLPDGEQLRAMRSKLLDAVSVQRKASA